ncbi:MAG: hypothetical protein K9L26_04195 [Candidatus Izimaplasma sp.]|nr:hypothetical protein [Candidatus Izimaplasma bacterium]
MLDKLKTALVLVIIGAFSGFLIWGVNALTEPTIDANALKREQALYLDIFDIDQTITTETVVLDGTLVKEVTILNANNETIGVVYQGLDTNNYGDVTVLVGVKDGVIQKVVIQSTTNTVTFVKTIENDYLQHFANQSIDTVTYDSKTGATYTYTSVSKIVEAVVAHIEGGATDE